jgi:CBS domain-containing protein
VLSPLSASDLVDSLHVFMGIKLKAGLADTRAPGFPNSVRLEDLSTLDRSLLEAALGVVRQFKGVLRQRFHLDALA